MHNFKNLKIWNKGIEMVNIIYEISKDLPDFEKFGLRSQMTRCAVSILSNIAEGSCKSSNKFFKTFLEYSLGSAFELETQLIIAHKQEYLSDKQFEDINNEINELQKMIASFSRNLS